VEALRLSLLFVHVVGVAAVVGTYLNQLRADRPSTLDGAVKLMLYGALVQFATGAGLVNVLIAQDAVDSHVKFGVKAAVTVAIIVTAVLARRHRSQPGYFHATGLIALSNIGVAVFWT
jgi:hypothetical protein